MAESVGLLASLLSPGAARQTARQQQLKNILSTANSSNPLLAEAGKTAGMFSQALGRTIGRDMRSEQEKSAERISNAVTSAAGDTLYDKLITAAKNPELSVNEKYILASQAQKIKPEAPAAIKRENFVDPTTNKLFPGVLLPSGSVRNLQTGELISGALRAGTADVDKPAEPKPAKPVEYKAFTDDSLDATIETTDSIKTDIEALSQQPSIWGQVKDALGLEVGDSVTVDDATYGNMKIIVERKAKEIQKQFANDPIKPRAISEAEALRRAIAQINGGDLSGIAPVQAQGRDRFSSVTGE